jgi:hypothetical protein
MINKVLIGKCGVHKENLPNGYLEYFHNNGKKEGDEIMYLKYANKDEYVISRIIPYINGERNGVGYQYFYAGKRYTINTYEWSSDKLISFKHMFCPDNFFIICTNLVFDDNEILTNCDIEITDGNFSVSQTLIYKNPELCQFQRFKFDNNYYQVYLYNDIQNRVLRFQLNEKCGYVNHDDFL